MAISYLLAAIALFFVGESYIESKKKQEQNKQDNSIEEQISQE